MIVLGNTASPGTIPKRLERLRDALEVVFRTKRLRPQGRGRLRYQKPVILWNAVPLRLSERHCTVIMPSATTTMEDPILYSQDTLWTLVWRHRGHLQLYGYSPKQCNWLGWNSGRLSPSSCGTGLLPCFLRWSGYPEHAAYWRMPCSSCRSASWRLKRVIPVTYPDQVLKLFAEFTVCWVTHITAVHSRVAAATRMHSASFRASLRNIGES